MKKAVFVALAIVFSVVVAGGALAATKGKLNLKVGDAVFVCGCGAGCPCDTMSLKEGNCTCGKPLVKGTVTKVQKGKATVKTATEERSFKTVGLYACACGKGCNCNTISQKPGNCACGKPMKKVGK
jgi:hypothetical protein